MYAVSAKYLDAIRYPHRISTRLEAWRAGERIDDGRYGAEGLPLDDTSPGNVAVDTSPGVRRTLTVELAPDAGLWDLLAPTGTELRPYSVLRYPDGTAEEVPLGRFPILGQDEPVAGAAGGLKLTASDLFATVQRARFLRPQASRLGWRVVDQIADLVRQVLGADWPVTITASSTATMGALVWERDRGKTIEDLARGIGADVAFAANGTLVIRDVPDVTIARPVWTIATGAGGVVVGGRRQRSRRKTYNVVVASPKVVDGSPLFAPVVVWDNDPTSPTYAGPDPLGRPDLAGPMGVVPYFITSELLRDAGQAYAAANAALWRVRGLEAQLALSTSPNLALDGYDVVDVLLAGQRTQRHVIDRVTLPLGVAEAQTIDTRSTRPDAGTDETS